MVKNWHKKGKNMKKILVGISFSLLFSSTIIADSENFKDKNISVEKINEQVLDEEILKKIEEIVSNKELIEELLPVTKKFFLSICNENREHFKALSKSEKMECYTTILYGLALISQPETYDGAEAKKRFNHSLFKKMIVDKESKLLALKDFFDRNAEIYKRASKENLKVLKAKVVELSERKSSKKRVARVARVSRVTTQSTKITRATRNAHHTIKVERIDKKTVRRGRHQKGSDVQMAEMNQLIEGLETLLG